MMTKMASHPANSGTCPSSAWLEFSGLLVQMRRQRECFDKLNFLRRWITICAWCKKKIRDSEGVWHQSQADLQSHEGIKFSHGICPECADRSYDAYRYGNIRVNAAKDAAAAGAGHKFA